MRQYRADLHIHSVLSPCASLDMGPGRIMDEARKKKLDIVGICDHNSSLQLKTFGKLGARSSPFVLKGIEINTREEVHCLAFFEFDHQVEEFQDYIDQRLPEIENNPDIFGYQVVVDENDNILFQENRLLISAIDAGIEEIEREVHRLNGIFIPAHVNRPQNGLYSQLGIFPRDLKVDALEIKGLINMEEFILSHPEVKSHALIFSSDAHYPDDIGKSYTTFWIEEPSFKELKMALYNQKNRKVLS